MRRVIIMENKTCNKDNKTWWDKHGRDVKIAVICGVVAGVCGYAKGFKLAAKLLYNNGVTVYQF